MDEPPLRPGRRPASQQYEDHENCADRFPFAYGASTDHLSGRRDAILKRPATDPLVLHTQSATEYWQRRGSLVHTDSAGRDLKPPDTVRIYLWASSQHFADPNATRPSLGNCQHYGNVVQTSMFLRAMLDALDAWATYGTGPPASRIPRRADGTLVEYIQGKLDTDKCPEGITTTGAQMDALSLHRNAFHGDWNYELHPAMKLENQVRSVSIVTRCHSVRSPSRKRLVPTATSDLLRTVAFISREFDFPHSIAANSAVPVVDLALPSRHVWQRPHSFRVMPRDCDEMQETIILYVKRLPPLPGIRIQVYWILLFACVCCCVAQQLADIRSPFWTPMWNKLDLEDIGDLVVLNQDQIGRSAGPVLHLPLRLDYDMDS